MYLAEGSDWMWWYGADQSSGNDEYFDQGFRALLEQVYRSLDLEVPAFVHVPIIPLAPAEAERDLHGLFTATIDGEIEPAGRRTAPEGGRVERLH
jgi:alpha-amylase/alpha-mannosidase (GH57 family)